MTRMTRGYSYDYTMMLDVYIWPLMSQMAYNGVGGHRCKKMTVDDIGWHRWLVVVVMMTQ